MYLRPKDVLHAAREARNNVPRLPALGAHVHERRKNFSVAHAGGLSLAKMRIFVHRVELDVAALLAGLADAEMHVASRTDCRRLGAEALAHRFCAGDGGLALTDVAHGALPCDGLAR